MELRETSEFLLGNAILNRVRSPAAETLVILALVVSVFNAIFFRELSQLPAQCNPVPPGVVNLCVKSAEILFCCRTGSYAEGKDRKEMCSEVSGGLCIYRKGFHVDEGSAIPKHFYCQNKLCL